MRTQTVRAAELDRFVEAGGATRHREEVQQYVQSMFDAGCMRPEWCFVIEEEDGDRGRVAFWTLPGMDEPLDLVLLDVPWEDTSAGVSFFGRRTRKGTLARSARDRARPRRAADEAPVAGVAG